MSTVLGSPAWPRSVAWLLFLGPFFFISYGFANGVAADRGVSDFIVFDWEHHVPFWAWTIVPYWSCDLLYGLSFLLCRNRQEVDRLAFRLLAAQLLSVSGFLLFPLTFTFARPATGGAFGWLFGTLAGFDQPYNQAPSLHVSLALILWHRYRTSGQGRWPWLTDGWFTLVILSTLTTYQHHFIDLPTGALVGAASLWLWPDHGPSPLFRKNGRPSPVRKRLASYYLIGAIAAAGVAFGLGGAWLWLCWLAVALAWVALCYALAGAEGFQKERGRHSLAAKLLMTPYFLGAWMNSRWWTRKHPQPDWIIEEVWLGRMPTAREMEAGGFSGLLDCTAELPAPGGSWRYGNLPCLDLVPLDAKQLAAAAALIENLRGQGPLLVCCALGFSRSASAVAAWLGATGRASTPDEAVSYLQTRRRGLVLKQQHLAALAEFQREASRG